MKKRFFILFSLICLAAAAWGCTAGQIAPASPDKTDSGVTINDKILDEIKERGFLIVGAKTDVPGLGLYNKDTGEWSGVEIDLAWEVGAKIFDVDVEKAREDNLVHFQPVTVADREQQLQDGNIDLMIATYTITKERKERFALSDSYFTDYIGIMVRYSGDSKDSLGTGDIRSLADLDGKYVGIARNSTTREDMLSYINTMNTRTVSPIFCVYDGYEAMFKALKKGDIDAMSVDVSILKGYVDSKTKILGDRFAGQHYGAAVKLENQALIETVNEVINGAQ